jgi:hypothetical protein
MMSACLCLCVSDHEHDGVAWDRERARELGVHGRGGPGRVAGGGRGGLGVEVLYEGVPEAGARGLGGLGDHHPDRWHAGEWMLGCPARFRLK